MQSFAGQAELGEFLQGTRVLINLLPNTAETAGIINQTLLAQLPDREPLPQESPLWAHPRVAMTPHVAAVTRPMEANTYIAETISRLERGEPVSGQVDRQRGY